MIPYSRRQALDVLEALRVLFGGPTLTEEERAIARGLLVKLSLLLSAPTPPIGGVVVLTAEPNSSRSPAS